MKNTRNLVITNGIPKNTIKFMAGKQSALEIGFNPNTNRLILTENDVKFGEGNRIENYVGITIKKKTGNNPYIAVNFSGEEKLLHVFLPDEKDSLWSHEHFLQSSFLLE